MCSIFVALIPRIGAVGKDTGTSRDFAFLTPFVYVIS